ncbi:hypothetical protein C2G38_2179308 [Gigaspora rosea]|uniref:Uncharacterized protein n=1 Tax=Gigaspora rosea TaxID=44941 RepID=A0A397VEM8_9GLOM|nr:hypothetical protein C2G38_2179308 [Gigaspora rosea]
MVYTDKCPVLSDIEWRDNCQFPVIHKGETLSDWMKRIWDQLTNYKNNNRLTDDKNSYECGFRHFMDRYWSTNCTGNAYCDISYKDYIELKIRYEASNSYFEKEAIHRYELWMQNATRRVKFVREIGKKIRAVKVIQRKFIEYYYRPSGLCASELAQHYQLLWMVREEMRQKRLITRKRNSLTKIEASYINSEIESFLKREIERYNRQKLQYSKGIYIYTMDIGIQTENINLVNKSIQTKTIDNDMRSLDQWV